MHCQVVLNGPSRSGKTTLARCLQTWLLAQAEAHERALEHQGVLYDFRVDTSNGSCEGIAKNFILAMEALETP